MIIKRIVIPICLFFFFAVSFSGEEENGGIYDQETELCWTDDVGNLCFSKAIVDKIVTFKLPEVKSVALRHYKNKKTIITYDDEGSLTVKSPGGKEMKFPYALIKYLRTVDCQQGSFDNKPLYLDGKNYKVFWQEEVKTFTVVKGGDYLDPKKPIYYMDNDGSCWVKIWHPIEMTYIHCQVDSCPDDLALSEH